MNTYKIFLKSFFLALIGLFLNACNTMEGVGKDVEVGGKKLKNNASEHK